MLHSGAYLLLLEALHRTSVTNVIVWRQLTPMFTMVVEQVRGM
jgi:drug/metabolite transporter (DMT)-like permease